MHQALPDFAPDSMADRCLFWADAEGRILDCCERAETTFRYLRGELIGRPISQLVPRLAASELLTGGVVNPTLAFQCRCGTPFRVVGRDGYEALCTLFVNQVVLPAVGCALAIIVCLKSCT